MALGYFGGHNGLVCPAANGRQLLSRKRDPCNRTTTTKQVQAAVAALGTATSQQQVSAAMEAVLSARLALRRKQQQACAACDRLQRLQWLHHGERPQPVITQQIRALEGGHSRRPIMLRAASGQIVWKKAEPANVAIQHYANVSRQPAIDPAAQADL